MINKDTLKLFNAIQIETSEKIPNGLLQECIKNGFITDINIGSTTLNEIKDFIGINGEKLNSTFHKCWKTIVDTDDTVLLTQQIMHYITTYGFEKLGIYNENTVYIPNEVLELPIQEDNIPLIVVKGLTSQQILEEIIKLGNGIALDNNTITSIMNIVKYNKYNSDFIGEIKNRELISQLNTYYGIVPTKPEDFLRYMISKLTGDSLIIKNKMLIEKIKNADGKLLDNMLDKAPENLASIFYRYKPLFLAMKKISKKKYYFNKLRKLAKIQHIPLKEDYLNNITKYIKYDELDIDKLQNKLDDASIFRKNRLLYALQYRRNNPNSIVYQVRNGRSWSTQFKWNNNTKLFDDTYNLVYNSIVKDIKQQVNGKYIIIPDCINYALPSTEKQFIGNIPNGTIVNIPDNMIIGVHWFNLNNYRVDLDLAALDISGKIGWDSRYKEDDNFVFSGDITDAPKPNGATEAFYMRTGKVDTKLFTLNYYNYSKVKPVECKIFVAHEETINFKKYMVDINNIICFANVVIDKKQNVIGVADDNKIILTNTSINDTITSKENDVISCAREYYKNKILNPIDFNKILEQAGAIIVNNIDDIPKEILKDNIINLSPEKLNKNSFMNLLMFDE